MDTIIMQAQAWIEQARPFVTQYWLLLLVGFLAICLVTLWGGDDAGPPDTDGRPGTNTDE